MPFQTKAYLGIICLLGLAVATAAAVQWHDQEIPRFCCYLLMALWVSTLKVTLPGINGTMSVGFLCNLLAMVELPFSQAILIGCASTVIQCVWRVQNKPRLLQVTFNASITTLAAAIGFFAFHQPAARHLVGTAALLGLSSCLYFFFNTIPIAGIICLTEHKSLSKIWKECYFWCFPYYLAGASIAGLVSVFSKHYGWQTALLAVPAIVVIFRAYSLYLGRLEDEKKHVVAVADLHLRTIEALALAIAAKDTNTHEHLCRVQVHCVEIGKELALSRSEMDALRAAALLHDIGKLAVPEHILSKPGKLTKDEFEKMKIHPIVGAEILEQVAFPYPVVPIVRCHHEKWDGTGYPAGLSGEAIPIGARILSAVDCLDALASDRPYRKAVPIEEAMQEVSRMSGKSFDPAVVAVLQRRYLELEAISKTTKLREFRKLSTTVKVENGLAPAAGFAPDRIVHRNDEPGDFLNSIAAARQEFQMLFEVTHDVGNSLSLNETLSVLAIRLKKMVPYEAIAVYVCRDRKLVPELAGGDLAALLNTAGMHMGEGVSGWVAENATPILNGNPADETHPPLTNPEQGSLRSAISVPLEDNEGIAGVLTLYKTTRDGFTRDQLRILTAISSKVGLAIGNALKFEKAESSATTDGLTGLPNAKALFMHLEVEVARAGRSGNELAVFVCDFNGFKQLNDRFGHLAGNRALQVFSQSLREICREYDFAARMGGDEFVLIVPDCNRVGAEAFIDRLQTFARIAGWEASGENLLSVSAGCAHFPEDGNSSEELLSRADKRMYDVKKRMKAVRPEAVPQSECLELELTH